MGKPSQLVATVALVSILGGASPLRAAESCLSDEDLMTIVRSAYTRSIGRVLHVCADNHRELDQRALQAGANFLTTYADQMRANRLAANAIMARVFDTDWQTQFDKLLNDATAGDEVWAHLASADDCSTEIESVEKLAVVGDYDAAMAAPQAMREFDTERANVPSCQ